jgi:hypothetical protein
MIIKAILLFLTINSTISAQVMVKSISHIRSAPREGTFYLKDGFFDRDPVLLDCASFLFGITFDLKKERKFFQLYHQECYQAYSDIKEWTKNSKRVCLKADFVSWNWSLEKQVDACEESSFDR